MSGAVHSVRGMLIDCDSCTARPRACGDCIVTHLLQVGPVRGSTEDSWSGSWGAADLAGPGGGDPAPGHDRASGGDVGEHGAGHEPAAVRPGGSERLGHPSAPEGGPELTEQEIAAVAVLSAGGLVPPLRLVTPGRPAGAAPTGVRSRRSRTG